MAEAGTVSYVGEDAALETVDRGVGTIPVKLLRGESGNRALVERQAGLAGRGSAGVVLLLLLDPGTHLQLLCTAIWSPDMV